MTVAASRIPSSFRDPSGFLFKEDGTLYRQINRVYREHYEHLIESGLYKRLVEEKLLISHEEISKEQNGAFKIIKPDIIPFISYPYEWCFGQLKDAALTTLNIQKIALEYGMSLKDASAYNIQFLNGKPILIDTLSFEKYVEGEPWVAYRQFCQHFLAPLALMALTDARLNQLARVYIDGIPLDMASRLLPLKSWVKFSLLSHIHFHAKSQKHFADKQVNVKLRKLSKVSLLGIIDNLENAIKALHWRPEETEWADYYDYTNYSSTSFEHKKSIISNYLERINPKTVWDLGANTGIFSRIASKKAIPTLSFDIDPAAVEKNYIECRKHGETNILPLLLDLTNPSPSIGWANEERASLVERGPADMVFALALIHHLAISNNLPFDKIASFLSKICRFLVIEFVPKNDSQVQRLLRSREDIFTDYDQEHFESALSNYFLILDYIKIEHSERTLYLMEKQNLNNSEAIKQ
ncbi:MAG TPA: hypothetical protein PLH43_13470 [Acetivibrio sp.]|uniref:hypothetical protein n=1 Tax=Acetivibrio sp. TaxID=1872092 RepID=UPI002C837266|nr:hypothetical protein [Acetivibrio sp.]HOM03810.1 hypothetical protein [Acetivibrio sp.]